MTLPRFTWIHILSFYSSFSSVMVPISKATYFSLFLASWFLIFETSLASLSMAISRKSSCWILARRGTHDPDAALLNFVMKNQSRMVEKERDNEKEKPRKLHERYRWRTWCYGRKISFKGSPKPRYSRVAIALWHMTLSIFLTINVRRQVHTHGMRIVKPSNFRAPLFQWSYDMCVLC